MCSVVFAHHQGTLYEINSSILLFPTWPLVLFLEPNEDTNSPLMIRKPIEVVIVTSSLCRSRLFGNGQKKGDTKRQICEKWISLTTSTCGESTKDMQLSYEEIKALNRKLEGEAIERGSRDEVVLNRLRVRLDTNLRFSNRHKRNGDVNRA